MTLLYFLIYAAATSCGQILMSNAETGLPSTGSAAVVGVVYSDFSSPEDPFTSDAFCAAALAVWISVYHRMMIGCVVL